MDIGKPMREIEVEPLAIPAAQPGIDVPSEPNPIETPVETPELVPAGSWS